MKRAILALAFLAIAAGSGFAQNTPPLQWELVNPFPFIHDLKYIDELRKAYKALPSAEEKLNRDSSGLERKLQNEADEETENERAKGTNCENNPSEAEKRVCRAPYSGWFARVAEVAKDPTGVERNYAATCWDAEKRGYRTDTGCENFINPRELRVRAWATGPVTRWLNDTGPLDKYEKCDPKYHGENCIEFNIPFKVETGLSDEWTISAQMADGSGTESAKVQAGNRLVVGLGDSYAVGEGNPDIPAKFTQGLSDVDFLYGMRVRRYPQKDKGNRAVWMDERCHRSMYSYQFKTALRMALEDPHNAVTFVSFPCTGGVTPNIIDKWQKPKEMDRTRAHGEGFKKIEPQLQALKTALGSNPRKIDYLLLSTGGNDANFAKFVAYVITPPWAGLFKKYVKTPNDETGDKIKALLLGKDENRGNYFKLQDALFTGKYSVKIRGCENTDNKKCPRIILTSYPDLLLNGSDEDVCTDKNGEFNVPFKEDKKRKDRIINVNKLVFRPLRETQRDPVIPKNLGWTVVEGHFDDYKKHGFCAQPKEYPPSDADKVAMPKRKKHLWSSFKPWNYRVYGERMRWIKIPVDSKLSADQSHTFRSYSFDLFFEDDLGNIIHPTAAALARTADANFDAIEALKK